MNRSLDLITCFQAYSTKNRREGGGCFFGGTKTSGHTFLHVVRTKYHIAGIFEAFEHSQSLKIKIVNVEEARFSICEIYFSRTRMLFAKYKRLENESTAGAG